MKPSTCSANLIRNTSTSPPTGANTSIPSLGERIVRTETHPPRPGTVAVDRRYPKQYGIPVVPHVLCSGFTREDIEYMLLDLQFLGITDLLVLRGDKAKHQSAFTPEEGGYSHAIELEAQINDFNQGISSTARPSNNPYTPSDTAWHVTPRSTKKRRTWNKTFTG